MSETVGAFKTQVRNLLLEYGLDAFVVLGYKGQDAFDMVCIKGEKDQMALDRLFEEKYKRDYAQPEFEAEWSDWDDEGEEWKE